MKPTVFLTLFEYTFLVFFLLFLFFSRFSKLYFSRIPNSNTFTKYSVKADYDDKTKQKYTKSSTSYTKSLSESL